jgi:mRNA interferase MazF
MVSGSGPSGVPERGDIVWIDFDPAVGHEQRGRRPALVVTPRSYNQAANRALICPITSRRRGYPFEVEIPSGLTVDGVILSDHVKSLDWRARGAEPCCRLSQELVNEVLARLGALLTPE